MDGSGSVTVAGTVLGSYNVDGLDVSASGPEPRAFLLRYASDGKPLWARVLGSAGTAEIAGLASDTHGNLVAVGSFAAQEVDDAGQEHGRQMVLAKFSPTGAVTWFLRRRRAVDWTLGKINVGVGHFRGVNPYENGRPMRDDRTYSAIAIGADGSLFAAGDFAQLLPDEQSELQLQTVGRRSGFVSKYTPDGKYGWTQMIGGGPIPRTSLDLPDSLEIDAWDSVMQVITGPGGEVVAAGQYSTALGIPGVDHPVGGGDRRGGFVAAMDSSGNFLWSPRLAPDHDEGMGLPKLAGSPLGVTVATKAWKEPDDHGLPFGARALSVRQYDWLGKQKWEYWFIKPHQPWLDSIEQVAAAPDGTVVLAAIVHGQGEWAGQRLPAPPSGGQKRRRVALLRLSPEGHPTGASTVDGGEADTVAAMRLGDNGDLYVVVAKQASSACSSGASILKVER